ncbi:hypothetical protein KBZ21_43785, partial [Streptomyces sp. A73]|nr:hypothetical protein [Streptomyces sp. A73]
FTVDPTPARADPSPTYPIDDTYGAGLEWEPGWGWVSMPAPYPYGETVVRLRRGESPGRDPRGQPIPGPLVETNMPGCV